ncbi:preprotein translocase subunit TatA [Janibacter cremeus]|uniref:Sec-independent protein translocase protein TatB n=1 Tax=Janibacter cremeus TaxID=1285192 RepID=A0A852VN07_9MICO|nr:preprotein translocase subunit TatA [Janibacter cremeus]NYF97506.1 sec-independent protein translocase protein TatB [Janibacter cremeus]
MPVNGWEFILLIVLAFIILGPQRMPEYAAKLARFVVQLRRMANDAKVQLKDQMGPEYEDLDWRQYDPRQYDPRRIVKQALMEPLEDAFSLEDEPRSSGGAAATQDTADAPDAPSATSTTGVPWDPEAT